MPVFPSFLNKNSKSYNLLILILLWGIIQAIAAEIFDMRRSVDTELYLENAVKLTQGHLPEGRAVFYASYSAVIAALQFLGLNPEYIIYIQFITAIAALISIYKLTEQLSTYSNSPLIAATLYILWFKFQQWNLILYTDAMFSHFVVISIYALAVAKNTKGIIVASVFIAFTAFLRPTGIGLLFAVALYCFYIFLKTQNLQVRTKISLWSLASILLLISVNFAIRNYIEMFFDGYRTAEIIYPNITLFISPPQNLIIPPKGYQPIIRLFLFVLSNPVYLLKSFLLKGFLFIAHIKPYYSVLHNLFIAAFLYPVYFFATKGLSYIRHNRIIVLFMGFLSFQLLTVCLTSENWDGRFLLPVLPLVFILAAIGLAPILSQPALSKSTNKLA